MKIYIIDIDEAKCSTFRLVFGLCSDVEIVNSDFKSFMDSHPDVDCVVSPANAFGQMTGGYDYAISEYLGWDLQKKVQKYIDDHFYGEQVVGTSFIIDSSKEGIRLIHTPTMRVPEIIKDPHLVYHCMRSTLMCALENNVQSIVIPVFGGGCGMVSDNTAATMMKRAYEQIKTRKSRENIDFI